MTLGDTRQNVVHGPWAFAAVCLIVLAVTLLLFGQHWDFVIQLLPGYIAAYLLIGVCIFGPARKFPSLRQSVAFLLPGVLLAPLALLNLGFWAGGWLLGLPAWGLLLSGWTAQTPLSLGRVLKFLGLLVLGLVVFTFNVIYPVFSLGLFLLPIVSLVRLAYPEYQGQAAAGCRRDPTCCGCRVDCSRSPDTGRLMVLALDIRRRRVDRRADDRVLGRGNPPPIPASAAQSRRGPIGQFGIPYRT